MDNALQMSIAWLSRRTRMTGLRFGAFPAIALATQHLSVIGITTRILVTPLCYVTNFVDDHPLVC